MIKQITVAECDICGTTQKAAIGKGQYNEPEYVLPPGWMASETTSEFCICPCCWAKLNDKE